MTESAIYQKGVELAKKLFGHELGEFVDLPLSQGDELPQELTAWVYGYLMQERPGVSVRMKLLSAIAMLTCLGGEEMLAKWIKAALNYGCTADEIRETIITMGVYAGFPVTRAGLNVAQKVFDK